MDDHKQGKDSDHKGVECLPRSNLSKEGGALRDKISVRRFPQSKIDQFGLVLLANDWHHLEDSMDATSLVDAFVNHHNNLVDLTFPLKQVQVGPDEKPYFNEELRHLKRRRQRSYTIHGRRSRQYLQLKQRFKDKLMREAKKYSAKIENEVNEGKRGSGYKAIRKLGNGPREAWGRTDIIVQSYVEQQLSPLQAANKLADHFSLISQSVDPLDESMFHPALKAALGEGRSGPKPKLSQHEVYMKIMKVTKPNSSVFGDIPTSLLKQYPYLYAAPVTKIFNKMIETGQWPRQ